ncbi:MAG: MFS transporter [Planctomycetota bacterium]
MNDRRLLFAAAFLRAVATGVIGVLLGIYLAKRGFDAAESGTVISAGLAGAMVAALFVTLFGDRFGRRRVLVLVSLLAAIGGGLVVVAPSLIVVAAAAFVGMINGMGRDRGAAMVIDQAILPSTTSDADRTTTFAWYNVLQDAGHALGALAGSAPAMLRGVFAFDEVASLRFTVASCAVIHLAIALFYHRLSRAIENGAAAKTRLSARSRRILWKILSLFALDSLAGGFLPGALLAYFFYERFEVGEVAIGALFFGARIANAGSHLGAAWLAKRIGLVNTMVFTHIPSSLLLVTVAFAPSFPIAALLFLMREGLVEMDVPTRQSFVMSAVRPEERTLVSGATHLVRLAGWAVAPACAGLFMRDVGILTPLLIGAGLKIAYDGLLYAAFRAQRVPEERDEVGSPFTRDEKSRQ